MVHNIPVVYDILVAQMDKHIVFAEPTKRGGGLLWNWIEAE
jgi:hypothetical protein